MNEDPVPSHRRRLLRRGAGVVAIGLCWAWASPARAAAVRSLSLVHTHTHETLDVVYQIGGDRVPTALTAINRFLRDHYTGEIGLIDPAVLDQLHALRLALGTQQPFEVISAYRCAATNGRLRATGGGGVATRSLHMDGRAIDVRVRGVALSDVRDAALALRAGGVGYYTREHFVHLDSGRVRRW